MKKSCEKLDTCRFFQTYKGSSLVQLESWFKNYCSNQAASENCVRKKIFKQTGETPADNMSPTGELL